MPQFSVSFLIGGSLTDPETAGRFVRAARDTGLRHARTGRPFEDAYEVVDHIWRSIDKVPCSLEFGSDALTMDEIERFGTSCREAGLPYRQYVGLPNDAAETTVWNGTTEAAMPLPEITTNGGSATIGVPLYLLTRALAAGPDAVAALVEAYRTTHDRFVPFDMPNQLLSELAEDPDLDRSEQEYAMDEEPEIGRPRASSVRAMSP